MCQVAPVTNCAIFITIYARVPCCTLPVESPAPWLQYLQYRIGWVIRRCGCSRRAKWRLSSNTKQGAIAAAPPVKPRCRMNGLKPLLAQMLRMAKGYGAKSDMRARLPPHIQSRIMVAFDPRQSRPACNIKTSHDVWDKIRLAAISSKHAQTSHMAGVVAQCQIAGAATYLHVIEGTITCTAHAI